MNDHLSIDGRQRFEAIRAKHMTLGHDTTVSPRMVTPQSMRGYEMKLYARRSTWRLVRNLVLIVVGAVALAWMCVP